MKTITLSFFALCATFLAAHAQPTAACDFLSISAQYISSSPSVKYPGKCDVKLNLSWELDVNNGNKYCYIHIWQAAAYQSFTYTNPANAPEAADLSASIGTIVIKDPASATPTLYATYNPDGTYSKVLPLVGYPSITLRKTTVGNVDRFTVENLVLPGVDCNANGIYQFKADGWASQQAQGKNVHCVSKGQQFSVNQVVDRSAFNCATGVLNVQLQAGAAQATGSYKVYADAGTLGKFEPATDVLIASQNFTAGTAALSSTWSYSYQANLAVPSAYKHNNYWVQIIPAGGNAQQIFQVTNSCAALPAALAYFTATRLKNFVSLQWQTLDEQDSKGFNVQRRTTGGWETIAFVPTLAPGGSSSTKISYEYSDANNFIGVSQYQLVSVSTYDREKFSEIKAVKGESQSAKVTVFPNPTSDGRVTLVFDKVGTRTFVVNDMAGRTVKQVNGFTNTSLTIENLQAGFYTIRVTDAATNETLTEKIVVNKR